MAAHVARGQTPVRRTLPTPTRYPIKELRSNLGDACQIVCKVLSRGDMESAKPGSGKNWRKFTADVYDDAGTQIQVLSWAPACDRLYPLLQPGDQVIISHFEIKLVTWFKNNNTKHPFFLSLGDTTEIIPYVPTAVEAAGAPNKWKGPTVKIELAGSIGSLPDRVKDFKNDRQSLSIDLIAMVVGHDDQRVANTVKGPQVVSNMYLANPGSEDMINNSLWGIEKQFPNKLLPGDLVILLNVSVSKYNVCSISTNKDSTVRVLGEWMDENPDSITPELREAIDALTQWSLTAPKNKVLYNLLSDYKKARAAAAEAAAVAAGGAVAMVMRNGTAVPEQVMAVTVESLSQLIEATHNLVHAERLAKGGGGGADGAAGAGAGEPVQLDKRLLDALPKGLFSFRATAASIVLLDKTLIMRRACPKKTDGGCSASIRDENGLFRCPRCDESYPTFEYQYILQLQLVDHSGSVTVTLFDDHVRKYLADDMKAKDLFQLYNQDGKLSLAEANQSMVNYLSRQYCGREMMFTVELKPAKDETGFMQLTLRSAAKINHAANITQLMSKQARGI